MYLRNIGLKNFRSIKDFSLTLADGEEAGWHVLLGPNGCGKSSVLKAIALGIGGNSAFFALRLPADQFLRQGTPSTTIDMELSWSSRWDTWVGGANKVKKPLISVKLTLTSKNASAGFTSDGKAPELTLWSGKRGWFSAAFGPMRRFTGDGKEALRLSKSSPRLARHLSIFGEEFALGESLGWLKELHHKSLEERQISKRADKRPGARPAHFPAGGRYSSADSPGRVVVLPRDSPIRSALRQPVRQGERNEVARGTLSESWLYGVHEGCQSWVKGIIRYGATT